jgi:hypothetical protein
MSKMTPKQIQEILKSLDLPGDTIGLDVAQSVVESLRAEKTEQIRRCFVDASKAYLDAKKALSTYRKDVALKEARYLEGIKATSDLIEAVLRGEDETLEEFSSKLATAKFALPSESSRRY